MTAAHSLQALLIPVSPFRQNCTMLFDKVDKRGVLIDPGAEWPRIAEIIAEYQVKIGAVWLTHGHIDHAAAAMAAAQALGVKIYGPHKADKALLDRLAETAAGYQWPEKVQNCTPDYWLEEGENVICGRHIFTVLHTPGHSPGHIVYFCPALKLAIVGDVLFRGAIGRTDFPTSNHEDLMRSLREKILPLGDDVTFICGHGRGGTIGREKRDNPFLQGL